MKLVAELPADSPLAARESLTTPSWQAKTLRPYEYQVVNTIFMNACRAAGFQPHLIQEVDPFMGRPTSTFFAADWVGVRTRCHFPTPQARVSSHTSTFLRSFGVDCPPCWFQGRDEPEKACQSLETMARLLGSLGG